MAYGAQALEAMNDMIKSLTRILTEQEQVCQELVKDYETVGQYWNDEKFSELGNVIHDIVVQMKAPYASLHECQAKIQLLRSALEEYLSTRV